MIHRSVLSCKQTKQKYSFENGEDRTKLKIRKCLIDHQKAGRTIVQDHYKNYKVSLEAKYEETRNCTGRVHSGNVKITSTFPAPKDFWGILKLKSIRDSK